MLWAHPKQFLPSTIHTFVAADKFLGIFSFGDGVGHSSFVVVPGLLVFPYVPSVVAVGHDGPPTCFPGGVERISIVNTREEEGGGREGFDLLCTVSDR